MWSQNHACRKLREPALGRVIPFAKLPEFRTREKTSVLISLLQVVNKTDTRVLWFSKKKDLVFVLINFMMSLGFKNSFWLIKKMCFEFLKKKETKKKGFSFCFFPEIGWYFILNKKWKIEKMNVLFVFFEKIYFWKWWKKEKMFCLE